MKIHQDPGHRTLHCKEEGCDFTCVTRKTLRRHYSQLHDDTAECRFKCSKCEEGFKLHSSLKKHEMTVCDSSNRPHHCDLCHGRFKLKQALTLHYHQAHKLTAEEARLKVYPGLPVPEWIGMRSSKSKNVRKRKTNI